jgi:hypothetical protein
MELWRHFRNWRQVRHAERVELKKRLWLIEQQLSAVTEGLLAFFKRSAAGCE